MAGILPTVILTLVSSGLRGDLLTTSCSFHNRARRKGKVAMHTILKPNSELDGISSPGCPLTSAACACLSDEPDVRYPGVRGTGHVIPCGHFKAA
jgi:hypothetical protein